MLQGEKTRIRAVDYDDLLLLLQWREDPEISFFLGEELPISREMQKKWFEKTITDSGKKKFIIETFDNEMIGLLGIMNIDIKNRHCECGITLGVKEFRGRGYASDALSVVIKFLFDEWDINRIYAKIFDYNKKSIHFFTSLGFNEDGRIKDYIYTRGEYHDMIIMSLKKAD